MDIKKLKLIKTFIEMKSSFFIELGKTSKYWENGKF